ncbi:MAG: indole-3-glycerol phosphate synthase TrpC [Aquificaceae bacterium]|nr:MAG: indole-3-glycerol phosphate synthase TrpC [Aquificaceae bacterium]
MSVLEKIVEDKLPRLEEKKANPDYRSMVKNLALERKETLTFDCSVRKPCIIAEIKQASPSEGLIKRVDPIEVAKGYQTAGACAISVLTEENYFKGSLDFLKSIRQRVTIPLLRKDFIVDELELWEAKAFGADLVLLIVKILDEVKLRDFIETSLGLGLTPLVEVFDEWELEKALKYYDKLVGVNNRNLETLEVDLKVSERILPLMKSAGVHCAVAESGISTPKDIERLSKAGADAFLIGTSLMKSENPSQKLKELIEKSANL